MTPDEKSHEKIENLEFKMADITKAVNLLAIELEMGKRELISIRAKSSAMQGMLDDLWAKTEVSLKSIPRKGVDISISIND